jgi:hypothetical protein
MNKEPQFESANETSRLLEELDQVLNQSSAMRDILRRYKLLHDLENITGPSRKTSSMRREIKLMEQRLRDERAVDGVGPEVFYSSA